MSSFSSILQFTNLLALSSDTQNNNILEEFKHLDVDKIHFSGKYPTVFFKEVERFDSETLKKIAKTHHQLWNYKKVMFLYVTSLTEIRIYNCTNNPFDYTLESVDIESKVKELELVRSPINDKEKLSKILEIFSASAIDSGSIWTRPNDYVSQIKLDKRIDNFLVKSLIKLANRLVVMGLQLDIVHSLLMRSLFVMYLEDKGATPEKFYQDEKVEATSYFDLLDNKDATYNFFAKIQENFNGNIFPVCELEQEQVNTKHLKLLKQCFVNGDIDNETLFKDWRIFKFDIIEIELLSQIYENFLSEIGKRESGSYYTPPELVELILNEVLPVEGETNYKVKVLDPTCGSGIFLVEAYKRIVQRWKNAHPNKSIDFKTLKWLMTSYIYGIEIDKKSIKVTTFSLYLSLLDFLYPKTLWHQGDEKFPYLINDKEDEYLKVQGYNLFRTDTIEENKELLKNYDIVVGNPPYGKKVPPNIKLYCNEKNFSVEFVIPFIHKSTLLSPSGKIALLMPTKLLTNTSGTSQNFRKWLFNENYVEKVYNLSILRKAPPTFGGQLFSSAVVPASIIFFQNKLPEKVSNTIEYWAPKTYIKSHLAEGVLIDSSDIKYLPRKECQKSDTKIWKISQWGDLNDFILLQRLKNRNSLKTFFDDNNIEYGVGLELSNPCDKNDIDIQNIPHMGVKDLDLYYTNESTCRIISNINFRRVGKKEAYKAPHILIKEGIKKLSINNKNDFRIVSSFLNYDCSYYKGIVGIHHHNEKLLKALSAYINSIFTKYFMFLSSSTWGIERDIIKYQELFLLPSIFEDDSLVKELSILFDDIQSNIKFHYPLKINFLNAEKRINEIIFKSLKLSANDEIFINDSLKYTIDLFYNGHQSIAVQPLENKTPETISYSEKLRSEINETLKESELKVIADVYETSFYNPLCLVVFQFVDISLDSKKDVKLIKIDDEFNKILLNLSQFTLQEYSKSIYVQKNLTYYDEDKIYIIKPNQKRFWNQSSAIIDAQNITLEIMSMSE